LPADEHPDRVSLRTGQPVRNVVMGTPAGHGQGGGGDAAAEPTLRWILVNTMPLPGPAQRGREGRVVTTFADITAQRRAAEVLRLSEEKYRGLVEHLPLLVLQFDARRRVTYLNPAAEAALGHAAGELAAGLWEGLVPADDLPVLLGLLEQAEDGRSGRGEFRFRGRDGGERIGYALAQRASPNVRHAGVTLLVLDMTHQPRP